MALAQVYEFKYPHEEELCLKHKLATRIWKGIHDQNLHLQVCECCGRKVGQQNVESHCCYDSEQLSFLGVGVPLFFSFLRYSIDLLFLLGLVFCIFGLYSNITSKSCLQANSFCTQNIFNTLSIINKKAQSNYLSIQNYILLAFVLLCVLVFQFFRYRFRKIVEEIDQSNASPSDYSLILKRLPEGTTKVDIQNWLENKRQYLDQEEKNVTNNLQVEHIIMSYDLTEFNEERDMYLKKFKQLIKQEENQQFRKPDLPKPTIPGFMAIVVFTKQQSKELFLQKPKCDQLTLYYFFSPCSPLSDERINDQRICIERAPEPDDILWSNSNVTVCQGLTRKIILGCISFILLIGGGFIQYGIAILQRDISGDRQRILLGTLASVLVTVTNLILQYFLMYSTFWQRMCTMTEYTDVVTFKLVFQQFLNSGLFVVAANIAANYQTFNLQGNLSETITQIMLLNAITPNITNFLTYKFDISGKIMRYLCLTKQCMINTQLQANYLYVLPTPILPEKYSYIIKTLWLTAFYAPFVPIVVPLSIFGLIFNFIVEKYLFGSSYSAPNMISKAVNDSCIELLEYVPLILSLGEFLIYMYFKKFNFNIVPVDWSVTIYISIGVSLVHLLLPTKQINEGICKIRLDLSKQPTYGEAQKQFEVTYEITNPAYQTQRPRLRDAYIWKKLFGHGLQEKQMQNFYTQAPMTDRVNQSPLLSYPSKKY